MKASVPVRVITSPPGFHWFGYYDKHQFGAGGRCVLGMETDFEHRSPTADDEIRLGVIDLSDGDRWEEIGRSRAWCWQQGCMLQWVPGSRSLVAWNDRESDRYVCRLLDLATGERRTIGTPIYSLSPDGTFAVTPDFRRINDMRPGYGYAGLADPRADDPAPRDSGVWRVDLATGHSELIVSVADVAAMPGPHRNGGDTKHYFNHLLMSPGGERFIFLHRWRSSGPDAFRTRMLTAAVDGSDVRVLDDGGRTSHFIWRDERHVLAWAWRPGSDWGFYVFDDEGGEPQPVGRGVMTHNGHCSYLPGGEWIVCDTYPLDERRVQELYLFHEPTGRKVSLGEFPSPPEYTGEWRCDLHPRVDRRGRRLCVDSAHGGDGRQMHLLDLPGAVENP